MMTSTPGDRARRDRSCHPPSEPWPETLKGFRDFCGWTRPQTAPTWLQSAPQGLVAAFRIRVLSFAVARACTPPVGVKARLTPIRARSGGQDRRKISPLPWGAPQPDRMAGVDEGRGVRHDELSGPDCRGGFARDAGPEPVAGHRAAAQPGCDQTVPGGGFDEPPPAAHTRMCPAAFLCPCPTPIRAVTGLQGSTECGLPGPPANIWQGLEPIEPRTSDS